MIKYKKAYEDMITQNKVIFDQFEKIHNKYRLDQKKWQSDFNRVGKEILSLIRIYDNQLCGTSENSGFGVYSSKLSEKFWGEIRVHYPLIDSVGITIL